MNDRYCGREQWKYRGKSLLRRNETDWANKNNNMTGYCTKWNKAVATYPCGKEACIYVRMRVYNGI